MLVPLASSSSSASDTLCGAACMIVVPPNTTWRVWLREPSGRKAFSRADACCCGGRCRTAAPALLPLPLLSSEMLPLPPSLLLVAAASSVAVEALIASLTSGALSPVSMASFTTALPRSSSRSAGHSSPAEASTVGPGLFAAAAATAAARLATLTTSPGTSSSDGLTAHMPLRYTYTATGGGRIPLRARFWLMRVNTSVASSMNSVLSVKRE